MPPPESRKRARFWMALVVVGLVGGLLSGAFGVGGGIIMVPLLITLAGMNQRRAGVTSLVAIMPSSVVGVIAYASAGQVDLLVGGVVIAGAIVGTIAGSRLLHRISLRWLQWLFIAMLVVIAARMLLIVPERGAELEFGWLVALGLFGLGLVMGVASGLFGIGGGVIAVPALVGLFGIGDLLAKGTSLLIMIPTAIVGTTANWRSGVVEVKAGLVVGVCASVAALAGAALAFLMSPRLSSVLFAALLLAAAIQMAVRALRTPR